MLKYGLIPEFIGRLPIIASLHSLDRDALIEILTTPRNALVKQYKRLFEIDNVELTFEEEALHAIADKALERKTGARGLRSIIEEALTDVMYEIPSKKNVEKCIVDKEVILTGREPTLVFNDTRKAISSSKKKKQTENIDSAS